MSSDVRLQLTDLTKRFGRTVVLDHVNLQVERGRIHGLIGQNGAGKSTLVKTLAGLYPDYDGVIEIDGQVFRPRNPRQSRSSGIAVIYQEFSLVSEMTIAENLLLGREPGLVGYSGRDIRRKAQALVDSIGIEIGESVDAQVGSLSPAVRQRIEIVKALAEEAKILVMDEPTARLSEAERASLFSLVRKLSDDGVGLVFISHYLDEVRDVTDSLTIMRNGKVVKSVPTKSVSVSEMASYMLGDEFKGELEAEKRTNRASDDNPVVLEADAVSVGTRLREVSAELRAGEILGVAGLVGSGRTRLARVLSGADRHTSGTLRLRGTATAFSSPRAAVARGIVLIPEDRKYQALSMSSPLTQNLVLMALHKRLGRFGFVSRKSVRELSTKLVNELEVSPRDIDALAGTLSGGNQQKVVLGKSLAAEPDILIIDQPTAGVDIGTKAQIHRLLIERARAGAAILVISDDLDELYALSDRFLVLRRGAAIWSGRADSIGFGDLVKLIASGQPSNVEAR